MILPDTQILEHVKAGKIQVTPFDEKMVQPASFDMKVGKYAATIPKNGEPRIDLEKEGFVIVAPYAPAVISTMEYIKLPLDLAGRFGLKSHLSRRGVYASVGPQVDPGFEGRLTVTLFNLTSVSVALNHGDAFLSLEFHRLAAPASRPYDGEYQGRESFTSKEVEPVLGYKGHGLSEVVAGFSEIREELKTVGALSQKFDSFLGNYEQQNRELTEFNRALLSEMKKLVEHIAGQHPHTVLIRAIPREQAKDEILALFREAKKSLFYSDVAEALSLDLELVVELCNELEKEARIGVLSSHEAKRPQGKGD